MGFEDKLGRVGMLLESVVGSMLVEEYSSVMREVRSVDVVRDVFSAVAVVDAESVDASPLLPIFPVATSTMTITRAINATPMTATAIFQLLNRRLRREAVAEET